MVLSSSLPVISHTTSVREGKGNGDHDRLSEDDMDAFVVFRTSFMKNWTHGHVFCSTVQFRHWFKAFTTPERKLLS